MRPLFNRGFAMESAMLAGLLVLGAVLGWNLALPLLAAITGWVGLGALMMTDPRDPLFACFKLAFACAVPSAATWVALLIHRLRFRAAPSRLTLVVYAVVPWVAALVAGGARIVWVAKALEESATYSVEPIIGVATLAAGSWAVRAGVAAGALIWLRAAFAPVPDAKV